MQKLMHRKVHLHICRASNSSLAQEVSRECSLSEHRARWAVKSGMMMNKALFLSLGIHTSWEMQTVLHAGLYEKEIQMAQF